MRIFVCANCRKEKGSIEKAIANKIKFIGKCGTFKRQDFLTINNELTTIENIKELLDL